MQPEANQVISLSQAARMIGPDLVQQLNDFTASPESMQGTRWQHAVTLVSKVSLKILDVLAPGHPGLEAVDVFGHALSEILGSQANAGS